MDPSSPRVSVSRSVVVEDGLGKRYEAIGPAGERLEMLVVHGELSAIPAFATALQESVKQFAPFHHPNFARVRGVHRLPQASALCVVSERVAGTRLSDILAAVEQQTMTLDMSAALDIVQQTLRAVAALHEQVPGACHGAIGPERIVVTPAGQPVLLDCVFGAALEQLHFSHERFWKDLRLPLPRTAGLPRFDSRADVLQVAAVALAVLRGRPLDAAESPDRFGAIAEEAWRHAADALIETQPGAVRGWLSRALQLDVRHSFGSAIEASAELDLVAGSSPTSAPLRALAAEYAASASGEEEQTPLEAASVQVTAVPATAMAAASLHAQMQIMSSAAPSAAPITTPDVDPMAAQDVRPIAAPDVTPIAPRTRQFAAPLTMQIAPPPGAAAAQDRDAQRPEPPAQEEEAPEDMHTRMPPPGRRWIAALIVLVALTGGGALVADRWSRSTAADIQPTGILIVNTNPPGASVVLDGEPRGAAPLTLEVAAGRHVLEVLGEGEPRRIPLLMTAGTTMSQHIDLPTARARVGQLQIQSNPSGARVTVDGVSAGVTPLTIEELTPGMHAVVLADDRGSVTHNVLVEAGATASLVVPMGAPEGVPVSGWISIAAPAEVHVYERGSLVGTSLSDRIMMSVGRHELEIANEALGYRATRVVTVGPGRVTSVEPEWPNGAISINAQPWAEVWINGKRIGDTPVGNVSVPIGTHAVLFRHPELGERTVRTTVGVGEPTLVSVDLRGR